MRVLVACECSGVVRRAFRALGHDAWSCDLKPAEDGDAHHVEGDALELIRQPGRWDLLIAHPVCTHLAVSGARWATDHWVKSKKHPGGRYWHDGSAKRAAQRGALAMVEAFMKAPIPRIAIENPISIISTHIRKPDQIIQPHHFGHPEFKATCLWLKNLPPLIHTDELPVPKRGTPEHKAWSVVHYARPGPNRATDRSRTYSGIAGAFAKQWGGYVARGARPFCKFCGASVPPINGEGTCPHCDPKIHYAGQYQVPVTIRE